uniref:Cytochrome P450 2F2-like n=1 Tax=Myripristis murdjan TaxID=586833 RepID=A0A667WPG8_9TELE
MLGSLILLWICVCLLFLHLKNQRPKNFPPGPTPLPIFGTIFSLNLQNPLKDLERLRKCYGNVYSLFIGSTPAVVINGFHATKEALVTKAADFSGRPHYTLISDFTKSKGLIMADYGPGWRARRRFSLLTLRNFGMGKQFMEDRILGETHYIVEQLEKSAGNPLCPESIFHNAAANIICQVVFGRRNDDEFIKLMIHPVTEMSNLITGPWAVLYDSAPMIRHLPLPFMRVFKYYENLVKDLINEHRKTRVPGEPQDFIDCYLDELDKKGDFDPSFSEEEMIVCILDLHFAGTDTTSNTLLAALLYLMNHPHIQECCQQEIDQVLDGKDQASFEDRHNMPYMQAVIHETQRMANTVPLSGPHCTTKDTELLGYSIPKGTLVIPNLTSVLSEEGQWKFPHEFNPENFLNDQGEFVKPEAFLPFSAGPRMCLGEGMARMELFLVLVTLLRKFKLIWPEDAGQPDYIPTFGITQTPKPFHMKVQHRAMKSCTVKLLNFSS